MPINSSKTLDPRSFIIIRPLPISPPKGQKLQARSDTVYSAWEPCREQVFRENYHRRQKQLSQQGYRTASGRPYQEIGEPLYLEPKKLILYSLGQQDQICKDERNIRKEDVPEDNSSEAALGSGTERKASSAKWLQQKNKENELKILKRYLSHTRQLVSAVKQGRGYFQILQREECDLCNAQQGELLSFSESRLTECQPHQSSSDEAPESEEVTESFFRTEIPAQRSGLHRKSSKKSTAMRPFTPVHSSLTCPQVTVEAVFRQLCSLNWLLEALTAEPAGSTGPVSSCWSLKDPGGSKMTVKRLNKEKNIETKWDQFITQPKPRKSPSRILHKVSLRSRNTFLSSPRLSVMSSTLTPLMGSMSSLTPGSEYLPMGASGGAVGGACESEDSQSAANISAQQQDQEEEAPLSDYLQKLLESAHQAVDKELHDTDQEKKHPDQSSLEFNYISGRGSQDKQVGTKLQRPKSSPANRCSETSQFIASKSSLSSEMRDKFNETAEEAALCLQDTLENTAKKRWENSKRKFQSLEHVTDFHRDISLVRAAANKSDSRDENSQQSTTWFSELLSHIPKAMLESRNVRTILEKLSRLCDKQSLRVRPNHFLKVLSGIRTWELCSPDLSVAIEIVREHIVQMSKEDYEAWLLPRVGLPQRVRSAPAVR
ncbi:coiled-coil domain-containing protein 60-like [Polyodon spathula]|uniref:coiled-coil domain-containing protein 60-like n=1 Tax=Polyodon spathula TaxID=7913 RepID=UPI001B7F4E19|nr:coiled-coil domain-containing protein 60-like [Polyodon spathula]